MISMFLGRQIPSLTGSYLIDITVRRTPGSPTSHAAWFIPKLYPSAVLIRCNSRCVREKEGESLREREEVKRNIDKIVNDEGE
jgi:hypothetical protein